MLLVVNEMRRGLDEQKMGLHLLGATAASILLTACALPSIVCFFAGAMPWNYSTLYYDIAYLALAVFSIARLVQLCFCNKAVTQDDNTSSEVAADENQEQI